MTTVQFAPPTTPGTARLESDNPRPSKRRRINLACERCRTRKSKCDGNQPICNNCDKAKVECVYREPAWQTRTQEDFEQDHQEIDNGAQQKKPRSDSQSLLEERLQAMEERLRRFEGNQGEPPNARTGPVKLVTGEPQGEGHGLTQDAVSPNSVDAMGMMSFADEQDSAFVGPSSNIAFLSHITNAVKATRDPLFSSRQVHPDSDAAIVNAPRPKAKRSRSAAAVDAGDPFTLPPEHEALDLAQEFFSNTGLLFPYVHADSFYETYGRFKTKNPRTVRISWLALFNMLLANAVSSHLHDSHSVRKRVEKAEVFYKRGTALSRQIDDQGTSLEEVQSLLLATQYLICQKTAAESTFAHHRLARAAFALGLHSPDTLRRFSSLEQEMRKRTWFACVIIDRNLAMTYGRPPSIPEAFVRIVPPNRYNPTRSPANGMPAHQNMLKAFGLLFFNATISLYKIMSEILDRLYGQNIGYGENESVSIMLGHIPELEAKLQAWSEDGPPNFQQESGSQEEPHELYHVRIRLLTMLEQRQLNLRNLLHRPVLQRLLDACCTPEDHEVFKYPHLQMHYRNSVESLVSSASHLIKLVHEKRTFKRAQGAWWYSLYYTFNSALILLAVHVVVDARIIDGLQTHTELGAILLRALDTFTSLDKGNMMIERCRIYLEKIIRVLMPGAFQGICPTLSQEQAQAGRPTQPLPPSRYRATSDGSHSLPVDVPAFVQAPTDSGTAVFTPDSGSSIAGFDGMTGLDIGPFMTDGNLDVLSFSSDHQIYQARQV